MTLDRSNGGAHGVNQGIGEGVISTLAHHLVKQLQRRQKDSQTTPCAGGEHHIFPAIPVLLHFTLEFLDQVIFDCLPDACWRVIPTEPCANLPGLGIQIREERKNRVQIDLNGLLAHTSTGFFAKAR